MSRSSQEPWSVPVRLDQVGRGLNRKLVADEAERARISKALELSSLDRLEAEVSLEPAPVGWRLRGRFSADLEQTCGVTLEPLPAQVEGEFSVDLVEEAVEEPQSTAEHEFTLESPDPPDVAENGVVDLAAYVVEHLVLELDPFPRKPGVEFEPPQTEAEASPFAVLAQLKPKGDKA